MRNLLPIRNSLIFFLLVTAGYTIEGMQNFAEFHVYPDDENDQVKVSWTPKPGVEIKAYYLEKSADNVTFTVWKKNKAPVSSPTPKRNFEIDFEPKNGWSYYRIREETAEGTINTTPSIPVFIGIERLQKGMKITPETLVRDTRQKASLSIYDSKSYILVLQDQQGDEYLYDRLIRATEAGLYIEPGSGLPKGLYKIKASSMDVLIGMKILVY